MSSDLPKIAEDVFLAWGAWGQLPEPILERYRLGLVDRDPSYERMVQELRNVGSYVDSLLLFFAEPFVFAKLVGCAFFRLALASEGMLRRRLNIDLESADFSFADDYLQYCVVDKVDEYLKTDLSNPELALWVRVKYEFVSDKQFAVCLRVMDHCLSRIDEPEMQWLFSYPNEAREFLEKAKESFKRIRELRAVRNT